MWIAVAAIALIVAAVGAVALQLTAHHLRPSDLRGTPLIPERRAPELTLTDQRGEPHALIPGDARVTLVFFGFTRCKDTCPLGLATLARVNHELGAAATDLPIDFITVDPAFDTPAAIGAYLARFDRRIVGLTGDPSTLTRLRSDFGVTLDTASPEIAHGDLIYLVGENRRIMSIYPPNGSSDTIVADVRIISARK